MSTGFPPDDSIYIPAADDDDEKIKVIKVLTCGGVDIPAGDGGGNFPPPLPAHYG